MMRRNAAIALLLAVLLLLCGCSVKRQDVKRDGEAEKTSSEARTETPEPVAPTPTETPEPVAPTPTKTPEPVAPTPTKTPEPVAPTPTETPEPVAPTPTKTPESVAPTPRPDFCARLLSMPQCALIGKTYADVVKEYGPLSFVYVDTELTVEFWFGDEQVAFLFAQIEIPDSWWTDEVAETGCVPLDTAVRTMRDTDVCTGVVGTFEQLGVFDFDYFENCFRESERSWSELDETFCYFRERGEYTLYSNCRPGTDRLAESDVVIICRRIQLPEADPGWENVRNPYDDYADGDWYYVLADGEYATGWMEIDGYRYYFGRDGKMAQGLCSIDGVEYFFAEHMYGGGPGDGVSPDCGQLSRGGFRQFSDGRMIYCDGNGRALAYDGQNAGPNFENYFEYAYQAFDIVWDEERLTYRETVTSFGFFDVDGDGCTEFFVLWDYGDAAFYSVYRANVDNVCYDKLGTLDGADGVLATDGTHMIYLCGDYAGIVTIENDGLVLTDVSGGGSYRPL